MLAYFIYFFFKDHELSFSGARFPCYGVRSGSRFRNEPSYSSSWGLFLHRHHYRDVFRPFFCDHDAGPGCRLLCNCHNLRLHRSSAASDCGSSHYDSATAPMLWVSGRTTVRRANHGSGLAVDSPPEVGSFNLAAAEESRENRRCQHCSANRHDAPWKLRKEALESQTVPLALGGIVTTTRGGANEMDCVGGEAMSGRGLLGCLGVLFAAAVMAAEK